jgi:hypothetical protein
MELKKNMYLDKNKRRIFCGSTCTIALILLLAFSALFLAFPTASAELTEIPTYSYVVAAPDPVGVGKSTLVTVFLDKYPPTDAGFVSYTYWDFTTTITDSSGNIQTRQIQSDTIGAATFYLTPDKVGTWTLRMHFEGSTVSELSRYYVPSDSNVFELTVQQDPVPVWPAAPLPTEYWQRPVEGQNRNWASIAGNWLAVNQIAEGYSFWSADARYNAYTTAPRTAHIMWTKPLLPGGIVGMPNDQGFYTGDSYERKERDKIIMNGVLYQNIPKTNNPSGSGFLAIDLRTGEELWRVANGSINFGQLLVFNSLNQHGVIPYLWNNNLQMFDATTGRWLLDFKNVAAGDKVLDENGNLLTYVMNYPQHTLTLWNATKAILAGQPAGPFTNQNFWRPVYGVTLDWKTGVMWNVTIPDLAANGVEGNGFSSGGSTGGFRQMCYKADALIFRYRRAPNATYPDGYVVDAGYSMIDGHQIWVQKRTDITKIENAEMSWWGGYLGGPEQYFVFKQETRTWNSYSAYTGELLWTTNPPYENPWGLYYQTLGDNPGYCVYDRFYTIAYDGTLHCFDLSTGNELWNYFIGSSGTETPYGTWTLAYIAIADGKVFISNGEHSPNQPLYRGYELYCVDAISGQLIWKTDGYHEGPIIADGYVVTVNGYDMQYYCFGKGPSAVTVSAPDVAVAEGTPVLIKGTVTDISPGTTGYTQTARFPNGVPAIADASMSAWMEYLYMQKPKPTSATGVPVTVEVIAQDGTSTVVGTATSDASGAFAINWNPTTQGLFTVIVKFDGTEAYYPSTGETFVSVAAAAVIAGTNVFGANMNTALLVIAVLLTVLVVFVLLSVRKRK